MKKVKELLISIQTSVKDMIERTQRFAYADIQDLVN